ncbi:hypothetical protein LOTGIDRAFT_172202 [Lottia gigantea]|uniref:Uncharacterized protein n=1 Tax=Lottia gigantea TaxID=225164 RepID=V4CJE7_LOTGI|nr:hypothetical protein LOTGIDRAFT_172202 [Lottia gigantea]ESP02320.1 hypothetical protein LOTGIDRAFT_172202 [Lottia gigantea]
MSFLDSEWTWLNGENVGNSPSTFESPGSRSGSTSWRDTNGDVWLFGGRGFSDLIRKKAFLLNDLWRYNIHTNKWTLVHPGSVSTTGGTVEFRDLKCPSPRQLATSCGVTNTTLIIYGGQGKGDKSLGDTWVYFIPKQRWLLLDKSQIQSENETLVNTTSSTDAETLAPVPRSDVVSWCLGERMVIFSGLDQNNHILHDMWILSLKTLKWKEIIYMTEMGKNQSLNILPRIGATSWVLKKKILYMFGGNTKNSSFSLHSTSGYISDLWKFNLTDFKWTRIYGTSQLETTGVYSTQFNSSYKTHPGSRQGALGWVDSKGSLWLFGGDGLDRLPSGTFKQSKLLSDVWRFQIHTKIWTWMAGSSDGEADVEYGIKGEATSEALIGGRCRSNGWTGRHNKFYIFAGLGHDKYNQDGYLNDLWLLDVNGILNSGKPVWYIVFFVFCVVSIILIIVALSLFTKDKYSNSSLLFKSRYDNDIKYSHLPTTGD